MNLLHIYYSNSLLYAFFNDPYLSMTDNAMSTKAYASGSFGVDSVDSSTRVLFSLCLVFHLCTTPYLQYVHSFLRLAIPDPWGDKSVEKKNDRKWKSNGIIIRWRSPSIIMDCILECPVCSSRYALILACSIMWTLRDSITRTRREYAYSRHQWEWITLHL